MSSPVVLVVELRQQFVVELKHSLPHVLVEPPGQLVVVAFWHMPPSVTHRVPAGHCLPVEYFEAQHC